MLYLEHDGGDNGVITWDIEHTYIYNNLFYETDSFVGGTFPTVGISFGLSTAPQKLVNSSHYAAFFTAISSLTFARILSKERADHLNGWAMSFHSAMN